MMRAQERTRRSTMWATAALLATMLCAYGTTTGGSFATDLASYEVTQSLVEHGSVAMSYNVLATEAERGVDGRYYGPVGIGHPLFGVPFYAAARVAQRVTGMNLGKSDSLTKAAVVAGSAVAAALAVVAGFRLALAISGSPAAAGAVALALGLSTVLWPYSKFGFNAPLATAAVLAGLLGVWTGTRADRARRLVLGGLCLGFAALTRHEYFLLGLPVCVWLALESRDVRAFVKRALAFGIPFGAMLLAWFLYNYARFGHPLDTGLMRDPNVRFDLPLLDGLYGLLLSPGRSLFLYNPVVIAALPAVIWLVRRDRNSAALLGGSAVLLLLVIAKMRQFDGGESWGPRYLVPAMSVLVVATAPWLAAGRGRRLFRVLVITGMLIQLPGVIVDFSKAQNAYARSRADYSIALSRYTWEAAPLTLNTKLAIKAVPQNTRYVLGLEAVPAVATSGGERQRDFSQQFAFSLDFWWLYAFYLGAAPAWEALAAAGILITGALLAWLGFRAAVRNMILDAGSQPS
jgi:hypothetical protein